MDSLISWQGGKSRLAKKIVSLFPEHVSYVEAFAGGMWVLFEKSPSKYEIVNDIHEELFNFWCVVKDKRKELYNSLRWDIMSRTLFNHLKSLDVSVLSDVERARVFYWMSKAAFGAKYRGVYGVSERAAYNFGIYNFNRRLIETNKRLKKVVIENKDYSDLAKNYDRETTLWYLDPPYLNTDVKGYTQGLDLIKFETFAKSLKGKVAISHNVDEQVMEAFKTWNFIDLGRRQNCIGNNGKAAGTYAFEWLITNYDPPNIPKIKQDSA